MQRDFASQKNLGMALALPQDDGPGFDQSEMKGILNEDDDDHKTVLKKIEKQMGKFTSVSVATTTEEEEQELQAVMDLSSVVLSLCPRLVVCCFELVSF